MTRTILLSAAAGLLAGTVASHASRLSPERVGLDVWNVPALHDQLHAAEADRDALTDLQEHLHAQAQATDTVVRRLLDGRVPLAEAAGDLGVINADRAAMLLVMREAHPGATDRELFARYAVNKVCMMLDGDPSRTEAEMVRLGAEFRTLFPGSGPLTPLFLSSRVVGTTNHHQ